MPIITSTYSPFSIFKNGHFSTIYASKLRKVPITADTRERITLQDCDFLDLDWYYNTKPTNKLVIIIHGLEGNAHRPYVKGAAKAFHNIHFDACAINLRGCSGEVNNTYGSYHSGRTEDLKAVIAHVLQLKKYNTIVVKGFSLGGNLTLKYAGESNIPDEVKGFIAVSVPCDLEGSMLELHKRKNTVYALKFKKDLIQKLKEKQALFPELTNEMIKSIKTLKDFDDLYTSKANNFKDAVEYYTKSSCKHYLKYITKPTYILNAKNDSFLSPSCYPIIEAEENKNIYLEMPNYGGHVGFFDVQNKYYNEKSSISFVKKHII